MAVRKYWKELESKSKVNQINFDEAFQ